MSLDGFITGPNDGPDAGLGEGGERLHWWVFGGPWTYDSGPRGEPAPADKAYLEKSFSAGGAMLVGRAMYDAAGGWGDEPGFGVPVFVVTHCAQETLVKGDTTFEFVTDGVDSALAKARAGAGEKNVIVMGGANLMAQYLDAGVVDELVVTIAPVLLGGGKRMFDGVSRRDIAFERTEVIESPFATHLRYDVRYGG